MPSATKKADFGLAGCVLVAIGGIGGCFYLYLAKTATPWYWALFVAGVLTVSAGYALGLQREGAAPTRTRWSPRRQRIFVLGQLALFYGIVANLASTYSAQVLRVGWASWALFAFAVGCMVVAAVMFVRGVRDPDARSTATRQ
jgi:hypothetical protein